MHNKLVNRRKETVSKDKRILVVHNGIGTREFLPPAMKLREGNVLHLCVILFTGGLCPGGVSVQRRGPPGERVPVQGWDGMDSLCPERGLCPEGVSVQRGSLSLCPGGLCLFVHSSSLSGDLYPVGVLCPGGSLSGGSLSRGVFVQRGVSIQGSLTSRGSMSEKPPYGNVRAVRILLECILVN